MKQFIYCLILLSFFSLPVHAKFYAQSATSNDCIESVTLPYAKYKSNSSTCESIHYAGYSNPYVSNGSPAVFLHLSLTEDTDIELLVSGLYNPYIYILEGDDLNGDVLKRYSPYDYSDDSSKGTIAYNGKRIATWLEAGDYIIEIAASYWNGAQIQLKQNNPGSIDCEQEIVDGISVHDGWNTACLSENRNSLSYSDPYSPNPDAEYRAKFFTISFAETTDFNISIESYDKPYIYILEGHGRYGAVVDEFSKTSFSYSLPAGDYTFEVSTTRLYAPSKFEFSFNKFNSSSECFETFNIGDSISGTWNPSCEIISSTDYSDPYAGKDPERAQYYEFSLSKNSLISFSIPNQSNQKLALRLFSKNNYNSSLANNLKYNYWYYTTPEDSLNADLSAGDYVLEVTRHNDLSIGDFVFSSKALDPSDCLLPSKVGNFHEGVLSSDCVSAQQSGTKYYKQFEIKLNEPTSLALNGAVLNSTTNLILSEKYNDELVQLMPIDRSYFYYSNTSRSLDKGHYVIELSSDYNATTGKYLFESIDVSSYTDSICDGFLTNDKLMVHNLNSSCDSHAKEDSHYYDPYGPNTYNYYYAKGLTVKAPTAGLYELEVVGKKFSPEVYRINQGHRYSDSLIKINLEDNKAMIELSEGHHTFEINSENSNQTGDFAIKLTFIKAKEVEQPDPSPETKPSKKKKDDGFLGLGAYSIWMVLLLGFIGLILKRREV